MSLENLQVDPLTEETNPELAGDASIVSETVEEVKGEVLEDPPSEISAEKEEIKESEENKPGNGAIEVGTHNDENTKHEESEQLESAKKPELDSPNSETNGKREPETGKHSTDDIGKELVNGERQANDGEVAEETIEVTEDVQSVPSIQIDSSFSLAPATPSKSNLATVDNGQIFKKAFEAILASKEAKKNDKLRVTTQKAIDSLDNSASRDPHVLFESLKLACETTSPDLKSKALDLFAKLFDNSQFDDEGEKVALTDASVDVISSCFEGEGTDPDVELQVVRALMNSVLIMPTHGASLLKAVRQIYNVFIFSLSPRNQAVAQGTLTQVIGSIFQRVNESLGQKSRWSKSSSNVNLKGDSTNTDLVTAPLVHDGKVTLEKLENFNGDSADVDRVHEANHASMKDEDLVVKDAFLIFRAMCKLSVKDLDTDNVDMRSHSVRSKLLSLHIIHTVLKDNIDIFLSKHVVILSSTSDERTRLIDTVRTYLCQALIRNAASPLAPIFELSLEIFWLLISNLRSDFKMEIPVFWEQIYFPVSEIKTSTPHQKRYLLSVIERLCNDSRCIIEFYLNYDCDSNQPNICEKIIDYLTKLSLARIEVSYSQKMAYRDNKRRGVSLYDISKIANLTSSAMSSKPPEPDVYHSFPLEYAMKMTSISCTVAFLRSLYSWAQKGIISNKTANGFTSGSRSSLNIAKLSVDDSSSSSRNASRNASFIGTAHGTEHNDTDDPEQFQTLKQRKKAFMEGVRLFQQKPKRGVAFFIENGFIDSDDPEEIAIFLLKSDSLDKTAMGEYLGEGLEKNIAIMHAFVDQMDFDNSAFVESLRTFLQSFRLPGEGQKIDRFMLKFAERYVLGNPNVFSNADAAYILAYSVVMLNTDQHSPQVKVRMGVDNFIANNSGIDDGKDLPRQLLEKVFQDIQQNEIKLHSEQHAALLAGDTSITPTSVGFFGGRDLNREAYMHASKEMSTKTEKLVKNLGKKMKSDDSSGNVFYAASHVHHVKSIFDTLWMSILAGLTPPFKEYDEEDVTNTCLEGIKLSIKIACMFELPYAKESYLSALVQFQNLSNIEDIKPKNVAAIYIMLDVAFTEGNSLKKSWIQVLTSISQLERLQLIAQGVEQDSIPDLSIAKVVNRNSIDSATTHSGFFSLFTNSQSAAIKFHNQHLTAQASRLLTRTDLSVAMDKVFTNSAELSGEGIKDFVQALSAVASEEIESSGQSSNPRMFSLQKVVDICYYNMSRIRLEWSQLWAIMGEIFNVVGCNPNLAVAFFALDSLRQLSMRFLDIDELSHFKFQKEFLKPFEHAIIHNDSYEAKEMVLDCINNMILAKADNIKSGWKTIFGVLTVAAKERKDSLVTKAYKLASTINKDYNEEIRAQDSFADLVNCFTQFAKNEKYQKVGLLSLEVLLKLIVQIAKFTIELDQNQRISIKGQENNERYETLSKLWFPVLFGFHDIIMTGEELEVRSRALTHFFDVLLEYGSHFGVDFWDLICHQLLFPIFGALTSPWGLKYDDETVPASGSLSERDRMSFWVSTTLIQALNNMVLLFSHYFDALTPMMKEFLDLLINCICQENDTIARTGKSCLQDFLVNNADRFDSSQWELITNAFGALFDLTTAKELFNLDPLKEKDYAFDADSKLDLNDPTTPTSPSSPTFGGAEARLQRSKDKSSIVVKCVLQLLMIETLLELSVKDDFYDAIPHKYLIKLAGFLQKSYKFAKTFNDDYDLRVRLWNAGVIERLPNLLKQESMSSAVFLNIMFRLYCDNDKATGEAKPYIMESVVPLCISIVESYSAFDEANQQKSISTWKPVIIEIFQGYVELDEGDFTKYAPEMFRLTLRLFDRNMNPDLRRAVQMFMTRVGDSFVVAR